MQEKTEELVILREKVARLEEKLHAANDALQISRASLEHRLDGMNEFREALNDQAGTFVTRAEIILTQKQNDDVHVELRKFMDKMDGKANAFSVYITLTISIAAVILGLWNLR